MSRYTKVLQDGVRQRIPYAADALHIYHYRMTPRQQEYFEKVVMPYYMDNRSSPMSIGDYKDLEYMGRAVAQNKDVQSILGIDYRQIAQVIDSLPQINQTHSTVYAQSAYSQPELSAEKRATQAIEKSLMQRDSRGHSLNPQNRYFIQTAGVDENTIPKQGWKIHISASNMEDYAQLLEKALPEFQKLGMAYKVVRPEQFDDFNQSAQQGKAITIYPTKAFNMSHVSPELKSFLQSPSEIAPIGDGQLGNSRMFTRYGNFRGKSSELLIPGTSRSAHDTRHTAIAPSWLGDFNQMNPNDIVNINSRIMDRYSESLDFKSYIANMVTMTITDYDTHKHDYIALQISKQDADTVDYLLKNDPTKQSIVYNTGKNTYALITAESSPEMIKALNNFRIKYERPEWDKRSSVYLIEPKDVPGIINAINKHNSQQPDAEIGMINFGYTNNNEPYVKVDTSFDRQFIDMCIANQTHVKEIYSNLTNRDLDRTPKLNQNYQRETVHDSWDREFDGR